MFRLWVFSGGEWPNSRRDEMVWLDGMVEYLSSALPASLWRWRWTGVRLAMPSIPSEGDVLKAPVIHKAALHCNLLSSYKWYFFGEFLVYHN